MSAGAGKELTWQSLSLPAVWEAVRSKVIGRKFVQDVGVLTGANFVVAVLNLVQGILVARWLGPELFGVAGLAMFVPSLVFGLLDARSSVATVKYFSEYHALGERVRALAICKLGYVVDLSVACLSLVIVVLSAHAVARSVVHDPGVANLIILYGVSLLPRALVGTSNALLIALGRFPMIALLELLSSSLRVVLVMSFVLSGWQVMGVIWANAVAAATMGFIYAVPVWVLVNRTCGAPIFTGRLELLKGERRKLFSFIAYNDLNAWIAIIPQQLDSILLGYFRGPTEVGYYRLAKSLSSVIEYIRTPLYSVSYARLARISGLGQKQALSQKTRDLALWIGLPLGMAVLLGVAIVPFALPLLVGDDYLPAIGATQLLLVGAAVAIGCFWLRPFYQVKNLVRELFFISAIMTIAFVGVYPFFVWKWGYIGAAGAVLAFQIVGTAGRVVWAWKHRKR